MHRKQTKHKGSLNPNNAPLFREIPQNYHRLASILIPFRKWVPFNDPCRPTPSTFFFSSTSSFSSSWIVLVSSFVEERNSPKKGCCKMGHVTSDRGPKHSTEIGVNKKTMKTKPTYFHPFMGVFDSRYNSRGPPCGLSTLFVP